MHLNQNTDPIIIVILLYINKLHTFSNILNIIMYVIYCNIEKCEDYEYIINNGLSNVHQWLTSNMLLYIKNVWVFT